MGKLLISIEIRTPATDGKGKMGDSLPFDSGEGVICIVE
jgi:hypothetical protein